MNLKLNNEMRRSSVLSTMLTTSSVKEERQRNGRYIAILVGILLLLLAVYHAWVRRIPLVASLVVPALIMFVYVGWVLYTASRDKKRALRAQERLRATSHNQDENISQIESPSNNIEIVVVPNQMIPVLVVDSDVENELSPLNNDARYNRHSTKDQPLISVIDATSNELDQKSEIANVAGINRNFKNIVTKKRLGRKYCRRKNNAVFKRSYSIA